MLEEEIVERSAGLGEGNEERKRGHDLTHSHSLPVSHIRICDRTIENQNIALKPEEKTQLKRRVMKLL